jgi:hypothetical protein
MLWFGASVFLVLVLVGGGSLVQSALVQSAVCHPLCVSLARLQVYSTSTVYDSIAAQRKQSCQTSLDVAVLTPLYNTQLQVMGTMTSVP